MDEGEWDRTGQVKRAQVYAGPAGLLLLLLLFLVLPAATVSCTVPESNEDGPGSISVSVSGADMVGGGTPDYEASGALELSDAAQAGMAREASPNRVVRVFGVAAVVFMGFGLLVAFVRVWRLRAVITAVAAAAAAIVLAIAEFLMVDQLVSLAEENAQALVYLPSTQGMDVVGRADEIVSASWGFWLTIVGLVLITGINGFLLLEGRARQESPADEP